MWAAGCSAGKLKDIFRAILASAEEGKDSPPPQASIEAGRAAESGESRGGQEPIRPGATPVPVIVL